VQAAVDAPRIHHQWLPDVVYAEPFAISNDTRRELARMGHTIIEQEPWGAAEAVAVGAAGIGKTLGAAGDDTRRRPTSGLGTLYGANDDRRPAGKAAGY